MNAINNEATKEFCAQIDREWKEKGHKVVEKRYWKKWDTMGPAISLKEYKGTETDDCLELISMLNNKSSISDAIEKFESFGYPKGVGTNTYKYILITVRVCCRKGEKFWRAYWRNSINKIGEG